GPSTAAPSRLGISAGSRNRLCGASRSSSSALTAASSAASSPQRAWSTLSRSAGSTEPSARKISSAGVMTTSRGPVWSRRLRGAQGAIEPCPGERPLVFHSGRGEIERGGRLFDTETGKVTERHDLRLSTIGLLELGKGFIESDEVGQLRIGAQHRFV